MKNEIWDNEIDTIIQKKAKGLSETHYEDLRKIATDILNANPEEDELIIKDKITNKIAETSATLIKEDAANRIKVLMDQYHSDDPEISNDALNTIVNENCGLINHFIDKRYSSYKSRWHDDLFQSGVCGLMESIKTYVPSKGRLSTHAAYYIEHELHEFVTSFVSGLKPHYSKNIKKVKTAIDVLKNEGNDTPTYVDIAMESGLSVAEVIRASDVYTRSQTVSADDEENECLLRSYIPDPQEQYEETERISTLYDAIKSLNPQEQTAIAMKYRLGKWEGMTSLTSADIAKELNVPIPNIKAILANAIRKMRANSSLATVSGIHGNKIGDEKVSIVPLFGAMRETDYLANDEGDELVCKSDSYDSLFSDDNDLLF